MTPTQERWPLWDLPTRLGHGLFIAALLLAWWSAETQRTELHQWTGYSLLVLVVSRLVWGIVGSKPSRFSTFLKRPSTVYKYLFTSADNAQAFSSGHNPAGGWSVVLMLFLLFAQAFSGLFNSDDILFTGPFYHLLDSEWQDRMGVIHDYAFNALIACVALHIGVVLFYYFRGTNLIADMIRGKTEDRYSDEPPRASWYWIIILILLAAALWAAVQAAPQPTSQWF